MKKIRHKHWTSSVVITGLILLAFLVFNHYDFFLMILCFVILQIAMALTCVSLILLRMASLLKNRNGWIYYFSGTMQIGLCMADLALLALSHAVIKSTMVIFLSLNGLLAAIIWYDIYKAPNTKGNIPVCVRAKPIPE